MIYFINYQKLIDKSLPEQDTEIKVESSDVESEPEHAGDAPVSVHSSVHEDPADNVSDAGSLFGMPELEMGSVHSDLSHDSNQLEWDNGHDIDAPMAPEGPVGPPIPDINNKIHHGRIN